MRRGGVQVTLSGMTANVGGFRPIRQELWIFSSTRESHQVSARHEIVCSAGETHAWASHASRTGP